MKHNSWRLGLLVMGLVVLSFVVPVSLVSAFKVEQSYSGPLGQSDLLQMSRLGIQPTSEEFSVVEKAWTIASPGPGYLLTSILKQYDDFAMCDSWAVEWQSDADFTLVRFNCQTNGFIYYIDTSAFPADADSVRWLVRENLAIGYACEFVDSHALVPSDAVLCGAVRESNMWNVRWEHQLGGVPVRNDVLQVQVNPHSGKIASFAVRWSEISAVKQMRLDKIDAIRILRGLSDNAFAQDVRSISLEWVCTSEARKEAELAWKLETETGYYSIGAMTGRLLVDNAFLYRYKAVSAHAVDTDPPPHQDYGWPCAQYVYGIMAAYFGSYYTNLIDMPSKQSWLSGSSNFVFFSVSHGGYDTQKNFIVCSSSNVLVYPQDVTNTPSRYLVYLLACFSAKIVTTEANCIGWQFVWRSRSGPLDPESVSGRSSDGLLRSAGASVFYDNAFVGFIEAVDKLTGCEFTKKFWDRLGAGDTVLAAKSYASSYYPSIGSICRIYGDDTTRLSG